MNVEDVWKQYSFRIKSFLQSRVSNPVDVDDLLQESLIKTFKSADKLDDQDKIQSWLFQIAHHTIIDFYRKTGHAKKPHPDDLWYATDDPTVRHELEKCVEPFIEALPEDMSTLLRMVDIEGRSQKDYADEKGLAYSTVKSRVKSARTALRALFEKCCRFELDTRGDIHDYQVKTGSCEKC